MAARLLLQGKWTFDMQCFWESHFVVHRLIDSMATAQAIVRRPQSKSIPAETVIAPLYRGIPSHRMSATGVTMTVVELAC